MSKKKTHTIKTNSGIEVWYNKQLHWHLKYINKKRIFFFCKSLIFLMFPPLYVVYQNDLSGLEYKY